MSYTRPQVKSYLDRHYRQGFDLILYAGTQGREIDPADRGRLLSVVQVDLSRARRSETVIPPESWARAQATNPGQWEYSLGVVQGWTIVDRPRSSDILPETYPVMGHPHNRGMVREITESERDAVLALSIAPVHVQAMPWMSDALTLQELLRDTVLNNEAVRISERIFNRVAISGSVQPRIAPLRSAPHDLLMKVVEILRQKPLVCALCGGLMPLQPDNKLLQISPDRKDSSSGSYGPENFQLVQLACNFAKNNATEDQFREWLRVAADGLSLPPGANGFPEDSLAE